MSLISTLETRVNIKEIIKRDGRKVPFNKDKIKEAIRKSFISNLDFRTDNYIDELASQVLEVAYLKHNSSPTVEEIQDIVEEILIKNNHAQVAKAYILYRAERSRSRELNSRLMKIYEDITFSEAKNSNTKRENANVNGDTAMGTMLKYGSEGAKQFFQMSVLNPIHTKAHNDGDIHIHDMDFLTMTTTCCQIDLIKLFEGGFSTGHGYLREPNDISSYSALACIAIQSNQNDQHGGQSIANFDYALAIGVKKTFIKRYIINLVRYFEVISEEELSTNLEEQIQVIYNKIKDNGTILSIAENKNYFLAEFNELKTLKQDEITIKKAQKFAYKNALKETERATFQAMEAFVHNLNTMHSRAGAQTPFSSVNYGMDTSEEGRMVVKNVLLALEKGLGGGETPIFPIHIFRVKEGINFNKNDKNYDLFRLACRVSAKRLFPNFSFQDAPFNLKYYEEGKPETEISYMGCRTRVMSNVYDKENETTFGRGNLSFTSINLPRIAIKSKGNLEGFFEDLDKKISLCVEQLLERFYIQGRKKVKNFPFLMGQGIWLGSDKLGYEDEVGEILKHGTLTIGFIGLAECLKSLTGKHHGESDSSQKLGIEIIDFMKKRIDKEANERELNFSLIATPAEGLSGRFVKIDKKIFGEVEGVTDRDYYTNSFHIPVYYKISAAEKIRKEAPYHELTNAGHITYVELDGDYRKKPRSF